jgi:hypothetical protein
VSTSKGKFTITPGDGRLRVLTRDGQTVEAAGRVLRMRDPMLKRKDDGIAPRCPAKAKWKMKNANGKLCPRKRGIPTGSGFAFVPAGEIARAALYVVAAA